MEVSDFNFAFPLAISLREEKLDAEMEGDIYCTMLKECASYADLNHVEKRLDSLIKEGI